MVSWNSIIGDPDMWGDLPIEELRRVTFDLNFTDLK